MAWIANLGARVAPGTIKAYLCHVRSMHVDADLPFAACEAPIVQRLIRGIKRYHGERPAKPKLPITISVLRLLLPHIPDQSIPANTVLFAACCVAYSGLLRCGEFTVRKRGEQFNTALHLARGSVQLLPSPDAPSHAVLTLPASKTDPFRSGVSITLAAALDQPSCPIRALQRMFTAIPRNADTPLFEGLDGAPLHRDDFIKGIRSALSLAGYKSSDYSGHSFRRGAATSAAAAGYSSHEIQLLGRWRSDAYKLYIDTDPSRILHLNRSLHWVHPQPTAFEPPALHGSPPNWH